VRRIGEAIFSRTIFAQIFQIWSGSITSFLSASSTSAIQQGDIILHSGERRINSWRCCGSSRAKWQAVFARTEAGVAVAMRNRDKTLQAADRLRATQMNLPHESAESYNF
jgi:hypothetical protein